MARRGALLLAAAMVVGTAQAAPTAARIEVWMDSACGCCKGWVRHMRDAGFEVVVHEVTDLEAVKAVNGIPEALRSCHTAVVEGRYVVEGHVPAADLRRLLDERPGARGLSVPGMPASAPGMDAPGEPFGTVMFGLPGGGDRVFARH